MIPAAFDYTVAENAEHAIQLLGEYGDEAKLLAGGERTKSDNRIYYPLNEERRARMPWSHWWDNIPKRERGPHDGKLFSPLHHDFFRTESALLPLLVLTKCFSMQTRY